MSRYLPHAFCVALVALSTGCTMCDRTYDRCGPTIANGDPAVCCPLYRSGSILSDGSRGPAAPVADGPAVAELPPGAVPTPAAQQAPGQQPPPAPKALPIQPSNPTPSASGQQTYPQGRAMSPRRY